MNTLATSASPYDHLFSSYAQMLYKNGTQSSQKMSLLNFNDGFEFRTSEPPLTAFFLQIQQIWQNGQKNTLTKAILAMSDDFKIFAELRILAENSTRNHNGDVGDPMRLTSRVAAKFCAKMGPTGLNLTQIWPAWNLVAP